MTISRRILFISLPTVALIVLGAVFYSSTSTAHQWQKILSVSFEPESATITLAPGETKTTEVTAIIDCKHPELEVVVSPELELYISVSPSEIHKCKKGDNDSEDDSDSSSDDSDSDKQKKDRGTNKVILNITAVIPTAVDPQTIDGTIWLESKKAASVKLPVVLNVWEEVSSPNNEISLNIPPDLNQVQKGEYLLIATESQISFALPPVFSVEVLKVPPEISLLPDSEALLETALMELEPEDFISQVFHDGGLEVKAKTFSGQHFFVYNKITNTAVEFTSGEKDIFFSEQFLDIFSTLVF